MTITGFVQSDFDILRIEGLENRMKAIQGRLQPKFQNIGEELVGYLSVLLGNEVFLHIARHARRTVNPPKDTWFAISNNNRGYKKHPHFQVGLFDDRLFIWLACIYELDNKKEIAKSFLANMNEFEKLPTDFVISLDHMKKDSIRLEELDVAHLERFHNLKSGEFLVGRQLAPNNPIVSDGQKLTEFIKDTFDYLIPFYKLAVSAK